MSHTQAWEFIDTGYNTGAYNMAYDESLLNNFNSDEYAGVFRLYGWNPPAISLGRFQNADEILNIENCTRDNLHIVRRITGGGAIFHNSELTYSLVCCAACLDSPSIKDSYRKLTGFLINAYRKLGLNAYYASDNPPAGCKLGLKTDFCFSGMEPYDILIDGKKTGGNAQKRTRNTIFQHGSIPLSLEMDRIKSYFKSPIESNTISLNQLNKNITIYELKNIIIESFKRNMGISFI